MEHFSSGLRREPTGQLKMRPKSGRFIITPLNLQERELLKNLNKCIQALIHIEMKSHLKIYLAMIEITHR